MKTIFALRAFQCRNEMNAKTTRGQCVKEDGLHLWQMLELVGDFKAGNWGVGVGLEGRGSGASSSISSRGRDETGVGQKGGRTE